MIFTECPSCDELIWFEKRPKLEQAVVCPACRTKSQVTSEVPLELEPDLQAIRPRERKRKPTTPDPEFRDLSLEDRERRKREIMRQQKSWRSHQAQRERERLERAPQESD